MRAVVQRVVEAEAEGEQHADRDRHVHVGAAAAERRPGGEEEDAAGIDDGRDGEDGRNHVKGLPGAARGAGPDRDGQQHDVHGAEAGDGERLDQAGIFRIGGRGLDGEGMGGIAGGGERADQIGRRGGGAPLHAGALHRQVDAGMLDARQRHEASFDRGDAGGAVDAGHREVGLEGAVAEIAAGEAQFLGRARSLRLERCLDAGRAATHRRQAGRALPGSGRIT